MQTPAEKAICCPQSVSLSCKPFSTSKSVEISLRIHLCICQDILYLGKSITYQLHREARAEKNRCQVSPQIVVWCFFGAHYLCIVSHCAFRCELKIPACLAALRQVLLLFKLQHKQRNNIGPSIVLGRYICSLSNVDLQS